MKKTLIVALMLVAGVVQAKEVNLVCQDSELNWKLSFDTQTSKGILNVTNTKKGSTHNFPADMRSSDTEYILFETGIEFRINLETLATTVIKYDTSGLGMAPFIKSISCSIVPAKNNNLI